MSWGYFMPWYLTLPFLLSSELDSDNDLFMDDEDEEDEDDSGDPNEDSASEVNEESEDTSDPEIGTADEETEVTTAPDTTSVSEIGEHNGDLPDVVSANPSQASTVMVEDEGEIMLNANPVENQSDVTDENGPEHHREETDEVEIVRVERQTGQRATSTDQADESTDDFQVPRKRRKLRVKDEEDEKEEKSKEEDAVNLDDTSEFESCPICFESWTNSGDHRLASLKCGHLFGFGCIDRWLKGPGKGCPQCNAPAKRKDIRVIYAKKLSMADTAEADRLRVQLENERKLRLKAESEAASYRMQSQFVEDECTRLKSMLQQVEDRVSNSQHSLMGMDRKSFSSVGAVSGLSNPTSGGYFLHKLIRLTEGGCRVMTSCNYMKLLCIAQASSNPLFRGFGIRKVHLTEYHMDRFLVLHSQMIRDLALHPDMSDGLLLSVSLDKTAKLVSLFTSQVVQTYSCPSPVWSCIWNRDNHHQFFTGLVNGQILLFDTRKTNAALDTITGTSVTPVCSLQYAPRDINSSSFRQGGLFVGQLDRISFLEANDNPVNADTSQTTNPTSANYSWHPLPLEGSVVSLNFDARTRHIMASFRPSRTQASLATVRHLVCQMESQIGSSATESVSSTSRVCTCNLIHALTGGRQMQRMVRSRLYQGPGDRLLAASGDEESGGTFIWDAAQGERMQLLKGPSNDPVIDINPFYLTGDGRNSHGLATLTETAVQLFRWRDST